MTWLTGTQAEVLFNMPAAGASLNNTLTKGVLTGNSSTNPPWALPAQMWQPSYATGRLLKVQARGIINSTATPTLTLALALDTTQGTQGSTVAATGAVTINAVTNGAFVLDTDITIISVGTTGNTYSAYATGSIIFGPANNTATAGGTEVMVGGASAGTPIAPSAITFAPATITYLELFGTWSAASTSNAVQLTQFTVYGMN